SEIGRFHAGSEDDGVGVDRPSVREDELIARDRYERRTETQLDTRLGEGAFDHGTRSRAQFGSNDVGAVDKENAGARGMPWRAVVRKAVTQLERELDAGEAGADDGERGSSAVASDLGEAPVESHRVPDGVDRVRLVRARERRPPHHAPRRHDETPV